MDWLEMNGYERFTRSPVHSSIAANLKMSVSANGSGPAAISGASLKACITEAPVKPKKQASPSATMLVPAKPPMPDP